jgi:uncharacterized SAM-binding protein YcdF (DUF218 family)
MNGETECMSVDTPPPDHAEAPAGLPASIRTDVVIIIFGAAVRPDGTPSPTLRLRVEAAMRLSTRFARPLFIPTGAKGRHGEAEAVVMARLLNQAGFPNTAIVTEETGTDTLSSVRAVRRLLSALRPTGRIYVATSFYHLPRCLLLLRLAGLPARAARPPSAAAASQWLRWYWRLRETPALPYDALLLLLLRLTRRL